MFIWVGINVEEQLKETRMAVDGVFERIDISNVTCQLPLHISLKISFEIKNEVFDSVLNDIINIYNAQKPFEIKTCGADENLAYDVEKLLTGEQVIILKKAKDKYKKIFFKEIDIAPYIRDVSVKFEDGIVKINAKLSASINQTHPHINPENIVTMLKDKLGILSGDVAKEQYDIIRTRIYFEDGKTDFR